MLAVAVNMALGRQPDCHCFGQLHVSKAGWSTLSRNGVLAAVAVFVVWRGPGDPGMDVLTALQTIWRGASLLHPAVFVWVVVVMLAGIWLYRSLPEEAPKHPWIGDTKPQPKVAAPALRAVAPAPVVAELEVDTPAPAFALESLHGLTVTLDDLRHAGQPIPAHLDPPHLPRLRLVAARYRPVAARARGPSRGHARQQGRRGGQSREGDAEQPGRRPAAAGR